jgi:iron complex outermembrane receptor protein
LALAAPVAAQDGSPAAVPAGERAPDPSATSTGVSEPRADRQSDAAADPDSRIQPISSPKEEEMVITGSRIERSKLDSVGPVSVFTAEDISLSGITTMDQLLVRLPSIGAQGLNANSNNGGLGLAFVDLRNLGPSHTLVLMNGRRLPVSSSGVSDAVDINDIPVSMVERVEVLRDGASSVYGSDAVAGVVNFILKDEFQGLELDALSGLSARRDGRDVDFSLTGGRTFDQTKILFNAGWLDTNPVHDRDRTFSKMALSGTLSSSGAFIYGSSVVPEGRVSTATQGLQFFRATPQASFQRLSSPNLDQRFNYATSQFLVSPQQRLSMNLLASHPFSDAVEPYLEASYTQRASEQSLASTPLAPTSGTLKNPNGLLVPFGQFPADFRSSVLSNSLTLPGFDPNATDPNAFLVPFARRLEEAGPRMERQQADSMRLVAGVRGEVPLRSIGPWRWDAFLNYGRTTALAEAKNAVNLTRANIAADPAQCNRVPGCAVANFVGPNSVSPAALAFITDTERDHFLFHMKNAGISATGPVFELPAGAIQLALGGEYRKEDGFFQPDPVKLAGDSANNQVTLTRGSYAVRELFWEMQFPLLTAIPFAQEVSANLAGRLTDYSSFGSAYTYRYGLIWAPSSELRLRTVLSTSFKAPGITDLFGGPSDSFAIISDPCSGYGASDPNANLFKSCNAQKVPQTFVQNDPQIRETIGGNPKLRPETSDFFGMGLVWTPRFVPELAFTVDYYKVDIYHSIANPDAQFRLDSCYSRSPNVAADPGCAFFARSSTGDITRLDASLQNLGTLEARGLDFGLGYLFHAPVVGDVSLRWDANYLFRFQTRDRGNKGDALGTIGPQNGAVPKYKAVFTTGFQPRRKFFFSTNLTYLGRVYTGTTGPLDKAPGVWYLNTSLRYDLSESWSLILGIDNLLDRQPPQLLGFANSNPYSYDFTGRFGYARVSARF